MPNVLSLLPLILAFPLFFGLFDSCGGGGGDSKPWTPTPTVSSTATVTPTATHTAPRAATATATRVPPTASPPVAPSPTPTTVAVTLYRAPALTDPSGLRTDAPRLAWYVPIGRSANVDDRTVVGGSYPSAMALSG